jgi:hypothetical protein
MNKYYLFFYIPLFNKYKYKLNYIYSFELNKINNTSIFPNQEIVLNFLSLEKKFIIRP